MAHIHFRVQGFCGIQCQTLWRILHFIPGLSQKVPPRFHLSPGDATLPWTGERREMVQGGGGDFSFFPRVKVTGIHCLFKSFGVSSIRRSILVFHNVKEKTSKYKK